MWLSQASSAHLMLAQLTKQPLLQHLKAKLLIMSLTELSCTKASMHHLDTFTRKLSSASDGTFLVMSRPAAEERMTDAAGPRHTPLQLHAAPATSAETLAKRKADMLNCKSSAGAHPVAFLQHSLCF